MKIKLTDRAMEAHNRMKELALELNDYQSIVMCIDALRLVSDQPDRFKDQYTVEDYEKVKSKLESLCQKHEIIIPDLNGFVDWSAIEIV